MADLVGQGNIIKSVPLGNLCEFTQGVQIPSSEAYKEYRPGLIRYLYIRDFFTDKYQVFVKDTYPTKVLNKSDIIMVNTGNTAGDVYRGKVGVLCNNAFKIHIKESAIHLLDSDYLWHFLNSEQKDRLLKRLFNSAGQPHVGHNNIAKLKIPLFELKEQRRIADILGAWDNAIDLTTRLVAAKQRHKKALMQQLLTGKRRFQEFVRSENRQRTKIGELPADWQYVPIRNIAKEVSVKNRGGQDYTVLSCTKYAGLVNSLEYFGRRMYSEDTSTYKVVRREQFAYATNHIEEGSIGYQDLYDYALISPMYTVFQTNDQVEDAFLYKVLKTELYRQLFEMNTNGSINRRGSLRWDEFSLIKIPLPSLEEQHRIAAVLQVCDEEIALLERKLAALWRQKRGLMQQLLTGRVRVKGL